MDFPVKAACVLLTLAFSCQSSDRPPPASDYDRGSSSGSEDPDNGEPAASSNDAGELLDFTDIPEVASSLCGETVSALELRRPNLYFLLDTSGSMTEPMPGTLLQDRFGAARSAIEVVLQHVGHRVSYGAWAFPASAECGSGREVAVIAPGDSVSFALAGKNGPKLESLLFNLAGVSPGGGTPTGDALARITPTLRELSGDTYLFLVTDGAPNCNLETNCSIAECIPNIEEAADICDEVTNCCSEALGGPGNCLDGDGLVDRVEALAAFGVKTFVIGIPGTEQYAELLERAAIAGETARSESPLYYPVADSEQLSETLLALGQDVALSCTIELTETPPDPDLVNVIFDEVIIEYDEENGWRWKDDGTVEIVGNACDLVLGGQVLRVSVVAGCPVVFH